MQRPGHAVGGHNVGCLRLLCPVAETEKTEASEVAGQAGSEREEKRDGQGQGRAKGQKGREKKGGTGRGEEKGGTEGKRGLAVARRVK